MTSTVWVIMLYVLATGEQLIYKDEYPTAKECAKALVGVKAEIQKNNPQVVVEDIAVIVCEPKKIIKD